MRNIREWQDRLSGKLFVQASDAISMVGDSDDALQYERAHIEAPESEWFYRLETDEANALRSVARLDLVGTTESETGVASVLPPSSGDSDVEGYRKPRTGATMLFDWDNNAFAVRVPTGLWWRGIIELGELLLRCDEPKTTACAAPICSAQTIQPESKPTEVYRKRTTGKIQVLDWSGDFFAIREPDGTWCRGIIELGELMEWCTRVDEAEGVALYREAQAALANAPEPEPAEPLAGYRVFVDDNFHFMDPDERFEAGVFATKEEALAKAKEIVENSLRQFYKPGMTAEDLWGYYQSFGDDPFIRPDDWENNFSGGEHARESAPRIISEAQSRPFTVNP